MPSEKLITADIVEVTDRKILTQSPHPSISVSARDNYDTVLNRLALQILSPEQRAALTAALTTARTDNQIVLKDDLPTYYPEPDIGEIKDSVETEPELPLSGNSLGDLRSVLSAGVIYRWTGSQWVEFIRTGTLLHTQLIISTLNASPLFQHLTILQKVTLLAQTHTHANKAVIDQITELGSGLISTDEERSRFPTTFQKEALAGTFNPPNSINRYVTSFDPRLNTVKNPYLTFGPLGSAATHQGQDIAVLQAAFESFEATGSNPEIKALEILPGVFPLNAQGDFSNINYVSESAIMLEALVPNTSTFAFETFQPSMIFAGDPSFGPATVRGLTLELKSTGTEGIIIQRDASLLEDCTFKSAPGSLLANSLKGLTIQADNCIIRRCTFSGVLITALQIEGKMCRVEDCIFEVSDPTSLAVDIFTSAENVIFSNCSFRSGTIQLAAGTPFPQFHASTFNPALTEVLDLGAVDGRILGSRPGSEQQAYYGRTRTLGPATSFADFVGNTEAAFLQAMADPFTKELLVLAGNYTFNSTVVVPEGVRIVGEPSGVFIVGNANVTPFSINSHCTLRDLSIASTGAPAVTLASNIIKPRLERCQIMMGADAGLRYGVELIDSTDATFLDCTFSGTRGLRSVGTAVRLGVLRGLFSVSASPLSTTANTLDSFCQDAIFQSSQAPSFAGQRWVIEGNHFITALPTKLLTAQSTWRGNWPHPASNNFEGVDERIFYLQDSLEPIPGSGCARSMFSGIGTLVFIETGTPTAATLPCHLGPRIDRTQGFSVQISWTANVFSGNVLWEVTTTFRDAGGLELAVPTTKTVLSGRSSIVVRREESATLTYSTSDFGFPTGVNVSHLSVVLRRLGANVLDTLAGNAHVTEVQIKLARD